MFEQIISGSIYQVDVKKENFYGFVFLKKNSRDNGFVVDHAVPSEIIKNKINGKIVTCVGNFPVTFSGVTGSKNVFLFDNKLITSILKESNNFCSIIK